MNDHDGDTPVNPPGSCTSIRHDKLEPAGTFDGAHDTDDPDATDDHPDASVTPTPPEAVNTNRYDTDPPFGSATTPDNNGVTDDTTAPDTGDVNDAVGGNAPLDIGAAITVGRGRETRPGGAGRGEDGTGGKNSGSPACATAGEADQGSVTTHAAATHTATPANTADTRRPRKMPLHDHTPPKGHSTREGLSRPNTSSERHRATHHGRVDDTAPQGYSPSIDTRPRSTKTVKQKLEPHCFRRRDSALGYLSRVDYENTAATAVA